MSKSGTKNHSPNVCQGYWKDSPLPGLFMASFITYKPLSVAKAKNEYSSIIRPYLNAPQFDNALNVESAVNHKNITGHLNIYKTI